MIELNLAASVEVEDFTDDLSEEALDRDWKFFVSVLCCQG
jgi:hypothetical protein